MLKNRFLAVFTLTFAAGVAAALCVNAVGGAFSFLWLAIPCVFAVGAALLYRLRRTALLRILLIVAAGLLCGGVRTALTPSDGGYGRYVGREDTVVGVMVEGYAGVGSPARVIRVEQSHIAIPKGTLLLLYADTDLPVYSGDRVTVEISRIRTPSDYLQADGVKLTADGYVLSVRSGVGVRGSILTAVRKSCERLYTSYGQAGTAQALLIRERTALRSYTAAVYRNAGLSHLLAISGLHLTVFASLLRRFLARMRLPGRTSAALQMLALVGYCALTAWVPSILRAAIMLGFLAFGDARAWRGDRLTTLFAALLFLLLLDPYALLSVSLQLSFLASLGLMLLQVHISHLRYRIRRGHYWGKYRLLYAFLASAAGSLMTYGSILLFTFPLTVFSFGTVAYLSPLINLPILPLFTPLLLLLLLSVLMDFIFPPLAPLFAFLPGQALRLLESALSLLYEAGIGSADANPYSMVLPAFLAACAVLSALLAKKHAFRLYVSFFAAFAVTLTLGLIFG